MLCFERHCYAQAVWDAVMVQYDGTFITRLRQLTLKFDGYKKRQNHTMRQHLTVMSNMIRIEGCWHEMTDEQQVQAVIRSLPSSWEHMRVNLTHNDNIKTFDDVARHVELEEDCLLVEKPVQEAFMTENKKREAQGSGRNKGKGKGPQDKEGMKPVIMDKSTSMVNVVILVIYYQG